MDREQVIALAPDAASISAAKKLQNFSKWQEYCFNDRAIWGKCKGSGSNPYLTRIDLNGHGFKCSCPSRKFPCKHALALFLLFVDQKNEFSESSPPDWVQEWLDSRDQRVEKAQEKANKKKDVDPEAQAKRQAKREQKIDAGAEELSRWLQDCVRVGLSDLPNKPYKYWDDLAARMVDAQAPGLAAWIRRIEDIVSRGDNAFSNLSAEFAKLHLFVQAYSKRESLPELTDDLNSIVGLNLTEAEILQRPPQYDQWFVFARRRSEDDSLIMQSTWFYGVKTGLFAKTVQYAHVTQRASLVNDWMEGKVVDGNIHFYPSITPLRCCVGEYSLQDMEIASLKSDTDHILAFKKQKTLNPWMSPRPIILNNVIPIVQDKTVLCVDAHEHSRAVQVDPKNVDIWRMLSMSGGRPVTVFGEWNGNTLLPLSLINQHRYSSLEAKEKIS